MSFFSSLPKPALLWLKLAALALSLYFFVVGVSGMGEAFNMFGEGFAQSVLAATRNPFAALMMGLLATSIVQSSSATTSVIVGMVAGGALPLDAAIPMVMGANIGTTITAMLVSFGSMRRKDEFERALSAALIHLTFNVAAVAVIFPLEMLTGGVTSVCHVGQRLFEGIGGMWLCNPLKAATQPTIEGLRSLLGCVCCGNATAHAVLMLAVTLILTYVTLIALVAALRSLVMAKVEAFFDKVLFRDWPVAMFVGFILTLALQTSSVTSSLAIALVGAGAMKLSQAYPFTLGTNVGTTITALIAALATGMELPVVVAFAHISFNVLGILIIWSIPAVRRLPLIFVQKLAHLCMKTRYIPVALIALVYYIIPLLFVLILA